ncbi:hypothetical protein COY90_02655, partial [Candidatus Roizmanbacteria bacterium CG_4_10_14_0_8_um_filter_39_9]
GKGNPLSRPPGEYDRKVKTQRNWRGGTQPVEHVVQFDTKRRTSPRFDMLASSSVETWSVRKKASTGAAWLSSARSVRSALKWDNERNPHPVLYLSQETVPALLGRKEGQTSSQHGPYTLGHTHVTMKETMGLAKLQSRANP